MNVRFIIFSMNFCLITFLLTGCWSKVEVNDLALVTALALDQTDKGKVLLTLELAIPRMLGVPNQSGGEKLAAKAGWAVSAEGNTILEAYQSIQHKLPRQIVFYHNKVIVIGEKMARSGIQPVIDFFERYKQSQIRNHILFAKGEAAKILEFMPKFEKLASEVLREEAKSNQNISVRLLHFIDMLMSKGDSPIAAQVQILPSQIKINESQESKGPAGTNLAVKGAAIFNKDKLIGWLNVKETTGAMWLKNRMGQVVTTVDVPKSKGGGRISLQVSNASSRIIPIINNKDFKLQVDEDVEISVYENNSKLDMGKPEDLTYVQTLVAEDIKMRVDFVCRKAQVEYKKDILGFGNVLYSHYPKKWNETYAKQWDELFPNLEIQTAAHVKISEVGLINKSISPK